MKNARRNYEQQLALKAKSQPTLLLAPVRRNRHLKENIIGSKDNEVETIFTPSAQAELLKDFYSIFLNNLSYINFITLSVVLYPLFLPVKVPVFLK